MGNSEKQLFNINEYEVKAANNENFHLHNHDFYEIYMFEKGDTRYIVDGRNYTLEPNDIIIIKRHEMHRAYQLSACEYKRTVLEIMPDFFVLNNCTAYEKPFLNTQSGNNKIKADTVCSSGLRDAFTRLKRYSCEYTDTSSPVCTSAVIEILYLINSIDTFSGEDISDSTAKKIILYLNNNFTENITIDDISARFFISKFHICRIFKKATGLTVHSYITKKRLTLVHELCSKGTSISDAAYTAGFGNYSSFYRAYRTEYGISPKEM